MFNFANSQIKQTGKNIPRNCIFNFEKQACLDDAIMKF